MYVGKCIGGPLDGIDFTSRYPKGILAVNRTKAEVAIYEYDQKEKVFKIRLDDDGNWSQPELVEGPDNRYRAAHEDDYDVVSMSW